MKYRITLQDTITKDKRTWEEEHSLDDNSPEPYGYVDYLWEEGSFSCDCNRSIFLWPDDESKHLDCSHNRIELIELEQV